MIIIFWLMAKVVPALGASLSDQVHQTPAEMFLKPGEAAVINCLHSIDGYDRILWYKHSSRSQMQFLGYMNVKNMYNPEAGLGVKLGGNAEKDQNCTLTLEVLHPNSSGVYFCAARYHKIQCDTGNEAYFGKGTKLTVLEDGMKVTKPKVKILRPSPDECRDQKKEEGKRRKTLVCVASGFYPDHVSVFWQRNNQNITDGVATDANATKNETSGLYSITSRLRMDAKTWFNPDNEFSCYVAFFNGTGYTNYTDSIYTNESDTGMTRERYLKITQNAKLSYSALILKSCLYAALVCFLVWKLQSSPKKQKQ
ncbi:T cell receptor beta chain MC.7.G5-like [Poeciliopsis prolifica]|uniref:T cell receptor beta chain MC.7.G5-like n=1 Tax=Poeciliopsis prolifica TaxID=188132 RepID=UPI0024146168|nr:T cell receptor beta chain MC.7.G5-like [Poeciliopsis prolifica]